MNVSMTVAREFERESHRIDQLIWDAMALRAGERVLFCGLGNSLEWIRRAVDIGVDVSVVSDDDAAMREMRDGFINTINMLRGSTSMLPAIDMSFDATVAFHYLHEVDPLFHANIVSEIARVGKRCVIVEPAPPSDPLGLRIAALYSRAKRELGQFENYHQLDYWRKLLSIVKPNVSCQAFTFLRTPPKEAVRDTVALIIDTMAAEATPESYLAELRALAARPDAQLVPQARYVIVGTSAGVVTNASAGTDFRDRIADEPRPAPGVKRFVPPVVTRGFMDPAIEPAAAAAAAATPAGAPSVPASTMPSTVYSAAETEPEFPAVIPPSAAGQIARNAFGLPPVANPALENIVAEGLDEGFGIPAIPDASAPVEFGWAWEPPENSV